MVAPPPDCVRLSDGHEIEIRSIGPSDAERLAEGLLAFSYESRYRRFVSARRAFSRKELEYLTTIDHHRHEALVAHEPGTDHVLAVARYVKNPDDPKTALHRLAAPPIVCAGRVVGIGQRCSRARE